MAFMIVKSSRLLHSCVRDMHKHMHYTTMSIRRLHLELTFPSIIIYQYLHILIIENFVIFKGTGKPQMVKENNYPYIIACGESQRKISRYFIEAEKKLIPVSMNIFWKLV